MLFQNPTLGSILFDDVIQTIANFVQSDPQQQYEVTIGSDSEQHHDIVECISAIVVHRVGYGARYFWMRTEHLPFPALRERIWHEAILSTTLAKSVLEALMERADWASDITVHVDVGERGPTRVLIREICGFVRASGFAVRIKPESYAASAVADRFM